MQFDHLKICAVKLEHYMHMNHSSNPMRCLARMISAEAFYFLRMVRGAYPSQGTFPSLDLLLLRIARGHTQVKKGTFRSLEPFTLKVHVRSIPNPSQARDFPKSPFSFKGYARGIIPK